MRPLSVSVVICTRNRADKLANALGALARMTAPPGLSWEVIVVDNGSTDRTKDVVEEHNTSGRLSIRYVFESKPGVSQARNRAIQEATGDLVASIDDDCIVQADWLCRMGEIFRKEPDLEAVGGRVELFNPQDKPVTIRTEQSEYPVTRPGQLFGSIPGCNVVYRREMARAIGGFDTRFGPGAPLPAAEDSDFLYRALKNGAKLAYKPGLCVFHDHGRRHEDDVAALEKSYLAGRGGFYCKHLLRGDIRIVKMAYWELSGLLRGAFGKLRVRKSASDEFRILGTLLKGAASFLKSCLRSSH